MKCVVAASLLIPGICAGALLDRIEASVNSSIILLTDIENFRQTASLRSQLDPLFSGTPLSSKGAAASAREIVDFLVDEKIITQEFKVSDSEVEQEINQIQSNNKITRATLHSTLSEQGFSFDDYFELIRTSAAKRNLIERDIRSKVSVNDDDVKNYYYNHYSKDSGSSISFRALIITISRSSYKTEQAAREAAETALQDVRRGEAFEEVARRVSDDASASSGGDLGFMTEGQLAPALKQQIKKMQIGEVSPVFAGPGGRLFILKLADINANDTAHFNKMKDEVRNHLAAAEYQHQLALWLDRQRQIAFIHRAPENK